MSLRKFSLIGAGQEMNGTGANHQFDTDMPQLRLQFL